MKQLNLATTFAATTVLTIFSLTCWFFDDRPFKPPMKTDRAAYVTRQVDNFGGMFGVRGPHSLQASAQSKQLTPGYEYLTPISAVAR